MTSLKASRFLVELDKDKEKAIIKTRERNEDGCVTYKDITEETIANREELDEFLSDAVYAIQELVKERDSLMRTVEDLQSEIERLTSEVE